MPRMNEIGAYHYMDEIAQPTDSKANGDAGPLTFWADHFDYSFKNFFHPFVSALIQKLNHTSVAGMLDPEFLASSTFNVPYSGGDYDTTVAAGSFLSSVKVGLEPKTIDLSIDGPYANYNWELLYHIPVMIAVSL